MTTPVTLEDDGTWCAVRFRYDQALVALLKDVVPWQDRNWNNGTKTWNVRSGEAIDQLVSALRDRGNPVNRVNAADILMADQTERRSDRLPPSIDDFFTATNEFDITGAAIEALDRIPAEHQHAVWRQMGKILLPDLYDRKNR